MQIQATPSPQAAHIARTTPVRATAAPTPAASNRPSPADVANRMVQAPEALPLSAIPTEWVPVGQSQRRVDTRLGPLVIERGNMRVSRDANSISVQQIDNKDLATITLRADPANPRSMVATTPHGTFTGRLSGSGNSFDFRTDDGRRSIHIERGRDRVRFETEGFGMVDRGHLNVYDR